MAWRRPGDKPLSKPMMVSLLTHIFVTRPQWVSVSTDICCVTIHSDCTFSIQYDANKHCYDMCICCKIELGKGHTSELFQSSTKLPLCSGNNHIHVDASFGIPSQYKDCLSSYGYFHDKDNTVSRPSYFYNRNSYTATTFYIETGSGVSQTHVRPPKLTNYLFDGLVQKDATPLLKHWSYTFFALTSAQTSILSLCFTLIQAVHGFRLSRDIHSVQKIHTWYTTKDVLCQLKYMTGMHTIHFVDIRNDCIIPLGGNGYKLR